MSGKCWSCNAATIKTDLFCSDCGVIQPVHKVDPFTLFGIPTFFKIDPEKLVNTYFIRQRQLHPDKFMRKSQQEREYAVKQVARLNEAYHILCNPAERAEYLIKLSGWETPEQASPELSQTMLLRQFEMREALDDISNLQGLQKLKEKVDNEIKSCISTLDKAFQSQEKESALCKTVELQFLQKFQSEIDNRAKHLS